jgi:hypothetical protein
VSFTSEGVATAERLTDLAMKVVIFCFVLVGVTAMTAFFIYCVMHDKGTQAKAISGYGDLVFFTAFGNLVWYFFIRKVPTAPVSVAKPTTGAAPAKVMQAAKRKSDALPPPLDPS